MSVEKYNELGAEGYQKWRAEQAAARRVAPRPRVIVETVRVPGPVIVRETAPATTPEDKPLKPSAAFRAQMKPGETYDTTRARLSEEYRDLSEIVNLAGGSADQQARLTELHKLEFELRGGGGG